MTAANGYCTLAELRAWMDTPAMDKSYDAELDVVIEAVSRAIDLHFGRQFYPSTATRYYTANESTGLDVDDLLSISTMATDDNGDRTYSTTWASTDYDLLPFNAPANNEPYTRIELPPNGNLGFPKGLKKGIKIMGTFGYATTTPKAIKTLCLNMAHREWKRRDAPFGVEGGSKPGTMQLQDFDNELYKPFRRLV
jgi:hypothetical protein